MENTEEISGVPKMEKRPGKQNGGTVSSTTPAFYVLVKQNTGKSDQGASVSDQIDCGLANNASAPAKSKVKSYLPADCTSGSIIVTLDNNNMWNEFYHRSTEMILTKQGRRMFPYCRYWIAGLESNLKYILVMDISPVDNFRYKWNGHSWEPSGKAEPHVLGRVFIHPESPSTGYYWMHQPVSFYKLKLTNNTLDQEGHIILHSMHRYLPRLHLVPADRATDVIQLNGPDVHTFTFPQTEFFAVTAYQNIQITQLKIDYNPFAKGFREDGLGSRFQRDVKQNSSSEQGDSIANSPSNHKHPNEDDTFNPEQQSLDTSFNGVYNTDTDRESLSPYHELLGFMETDMDISNDSLLKQEASESSVDIPCRSITQAESLRSNGNVSVIKEEPVDDYDYEPKKITEDVHVKLEDVDDVAEDSSSSDSILEQKLKKQRKQRRKETHRKRPQTSQLGVAKAKMLKSDTGKIPVVYLESCAGTRNTVMATGDSQPVLSPSKSGKSSDHSMDSFPNCFGNSSIYISPVTTETDERLTGKQTSESATLQKCSSIKKVQRDHTETSNSVAITNRLSCDKLKSIAYNGPFWSKSVSGGNKSTLTNHILHKSIIGDQNVDLSGPRKRGRPRKIKKLGVGRPPKYAGKPVVTHTYASLGLSSPHSDIKPDLVDVDGVLFVSFASKESLDTHTVDRCEEKELQKTKIPSVPVGDRCSDQDNVKIQKLEKELLEDLKSFKYKQVIHPSLQEVGLKLNFVDPTMSIDLKYLGVQLPLSYSDDYTLWKNLGTGSSSVEAGLPFVSRTGKTNDFTKIKGWQGKLHSSSKNEGIILEASLKNRSAFCSDKLDEYLENEGKLLETSMGLSPSTSSCPVVYQLPTKSTSYVRTLDSVLKKQSTITTSSRYTFKSLSMPSVSKKKREKVKNKKGAVSKGKEKSFSKSRVTLPVASKQKRTLSVLEQKVTKPQLSSQGSNDVGASMMSSAEENLHGKHTALRQSQQPSQQSRLPGLSKTHLKLMDLEDCALWDCKPRTYITVERADLSLTALLTVQASLKNKPIHKIIKRQAPPCNNDFCRLGCVCSSLALEKHQPTHCRKTDCMFGCSCLKRKVVLVKGTSKHKKMLKNPQQERQKLHCGEKQEQEEMLEKEKEPEKLKEKDKKKKKKKVEYSICGTMPERPVKNFPLWVKEDGEMDPEPVYIPKASTPEPTKSAIPPILDVSSSDNNPAVTDTKLWANDVKSPRVYTPKTTPVKILEEDREPIYLYFESMMTCARVRMYNRKTQEKKQHEKCLSDDEKSIEKECDSEPKPIKTEDDQESGDTTKPEDDKESEEKNWWFSCSAEDPSTSYVHHTTPGGRTKLIEIVSECNWEEDRNEILNILSQHIHSKMPMSLKIGNFAIDLESESKTCDENTAIQSSRVKISMPSCQNKTDTAQISVSEAPDDVLSSCKKTEKIDLLTPGMLREQRKKGLPFYAGLSPAGKLIAYTCKPDLNPSCLIQVNGKNYPQAKLLLGQMGALHPASHLAAYLTGRLRPGMLDLSTISTTISKVAPSTKYTASKPKSTVVPTSKTSKPILPNSTSNSTVIGSNVRVTSQRQIAARPSTDGVTSQLVVSAVGALQQKIPGIRTPQPLTGPQIFNIKPAPLSLGTNVVTAAATMPSVPITIPGLSSYNKANCSSAIAIVNAAGKPENSSAMTTTATVKITKSTGIAAPVATIAFAKSVVATSTSGSSASLCGIPVTGSTATVTTPPSPTACGGPGPSGIPLSNQKPGTTSPPSLPAGAEKRMGPRLLLIPVHPGSPTLRPPQNMQLGQGKRMILQPIRTPGGANLYRHPNGQIIQLVPLHQLQPTSPQSNSPSVLFRNPGSVVGIRFPGPSKPSETSICQSSAVSSVIPSTTSILSVTPSSVPTSTEIPTDLSGTLGTSPSVLPCTPCKDISLISLPPAVEASSSLSLAPSISTPFLTVSPSAAPVLSAAKSPPVSPPAEAPLVFPVPSTESVSSVTDAPSASPKPVTTEVSSVSPEFCTAEASLTLVAPSSIPPAPPISEATSVSPTHPSINWTPEAIRSVPELPVLTNQAVSVMPPVFVPVSQAGTLTLRISSSGIRTMNSDYKITCSKKEQPDSKANLGSLHSGSFALLQFPEQNNDPGSVPKQMVSLQVKNNEISAIREEEKMACSQVVKVVKLEDKLPAYQSETHSEEGACETLNRDEKGTKILDQISNHVPILKSFVTSLDCAYVFEEQKCERKEGTVKEKQHVKSPEDSPSALPHAPDVMPEKCSKHAALAPSTLKQQKVTPLKLSDIEQTHYDHTNSPPPGREVEPILLDAEEGMSFDQSQKQLSNQKENLNSTDGLQEERKLLLSSFENQGPDSLERNVKDKKNYMTGNGEEEQIIEKPKIVSRKLHNAQEVKCVDGAQEICQENCNTSTHKNGTACTQVEKQTIKNSLVEIGKTGSKTSRHSTALENKTSMSIDDFLDKLPKCVEQSEQKTGHFRSDSPLIDITTDDTEKDEKTDDSADEIMDEISGYQSEDIVNIETMDESQSSEAEETVDIETVEELSEKINIARLKATAAHTRLSKQLHLVPDPLNKVTAKSPKQSESPNKKPKNAEAAFANYRQTHTANERRRRKEMRGLFEQLKATLGLDSLPKVSKCFILKQAFEEIQGLTDQADKLAGQKKLLMRKQDTLIRKVSALSGKTQEVVLKKLEYIYAKQKAVEAQKKKQHQEDPMKITETTETATETVGPPSENSRPPLAKETKPVILSKSRTKPLILSRKGSHILGETPSMALTNASLVMTTDGPVLAFKSPLVPGQVTSLPSALMQTELMSENDNSNRTVQQGITSLMIQLPSSAVPVQMKGILPTSTVPITLSAAANSSAAPVVQATPKLSSENEDSFMMPKIVNVTSLATKEATNLNLDANKNLYVNLHGNSQTFQPSYLSQATTSLQSKSKCQASGKGRNATGTAQDFHEEDDGTPQIVNISTLKGSTAPFATELSIDELVGNQTREKLMNKKSDGQVSRDYSFQKLQQPKVSELEMELQKVAAVIHEPSLDTNDLMDIEENDDTDETLTSLLNEIAFLNQQLNDDASDMSELPNFSLRGSENHQESTTAGSSPFQFGTVGGNFKDLSVVRGNSDSITPLLLHLDDDDLPDGSRISEEVSSKSDSLKIMLSSEVTDRNPNLSARSSDGNKKFVVSLSKPRSVSPPILQMKTNLETGKTDMGWRPMPKLAPLGLKGANLSSDSEGQNTRAMPSLAHVPSKEIKTVQPITGPSQDPKGTLTLALVAKKSK